MFTVFHILQLLSFQSTVNKLPFVSKVNLRLYVRIVNNNNLKTTLTKKCYRNLPLYRKNFMKNCILLKNCGKSFSMSQELAHFMPLVSFYTRGKYEKTTYFLKTTRLLIYAVGIDSKRSVASTGL